MSSTTVATLASIAALLILDFLWIGLYMKNQYNVLIPSIQGGEMTTRLDAAILTYALMIIGLVFFVQPRAFSVLGSIKYGFIFGTVLYGVFSFTNLTVITDWGEQIAYMDTLWGGIVYALAALVYFYVRTK